MKKNNALKSFFLNPGSGLPVGWNFDGRAEGAGGYGGVWATPVAFLKLIYLKRRRNLTSKWLPAQRYVRYTRGTQPPPRPRFKRDLGRFVSRNSLGISVRLRLTVGHEPSIKLDFLSPSAASCCWYLSFYICVFMSRAASASPGLVR
jgi:hypothetical protein